MAKKSTIQGIRKDASEANKEFYAEMYNLSQVCKYWRETTKYEVDSKTGKTVKIEILRPKRDNFLEKVSKYVTPAQITPAFVVANSTDTVNGKIMKRKRIETAESTEDNKKYKFVLSDVERTQFSPAFVSACIINYANKQAALIGVNSGAPKQVVKPVLEQQGEAAAAMKQTEKTIVQTAKNIARNKRNTAESKANKIKKVA